MRNNLHIIKEVVYSMCNLLYKWQYAMTSQSQQN